MALSDGVGGGGVVASDGFEALKGVEAFQCGQSVPVDPGDGGDRGVE